MCKHCNIRNNCSLLRTLIHFGGRKEFELRKQTCLETNFHIRGFEESFCIWLQNISTIFSQNTGKGGIFMIFL